MLRDWSTGKFPRYSTPPSKAASPLTEAATEKYYAADASILANLRPRKEMRKNGGLIKFVSGVVESRKAVTEGPWNSLKEENDEMEVDDEDDALIEVDEDEEIGGEEDEDDELEEQEDDDQEDADVVLPPISNKQKRKRTNEAPAAPPSKKASFSSNPKISKQPAPKSKDAGKSGLKSKLIAPKPAQPKPATISREQKVANGAIKKAVAAKSSIESGDAYDFGKFF